MSIASLSSGNPAAAVPAAALSWSVVSDLAELEKLAPAWRALLQRSAANEPMLSPTWLLAWWRIYGQGTGRQLRVLLFTQGEQLIGLAPLLRRLCWYRPGLPFRRLEPLGADQEERDAICSDYLNIIAARGQEETVAQALVQALTSGALGRWDEIVLPAMNGLGLMPALLTQAFRSAGYQTETVATGIAPYIPLPATWEEYLKALGKKNRYNVLRALSDFESWAQGDAQFHCASTPAELAEGKRILFMLHAERWQGAAKTGVFHAARFADFHNTVMPQLLSEGALQLLWVSVRGEPVAVDYNLVWNGKCYFYQSGRKLELPKGVKPGTVVHLHAIQQALRAGYREYDFLAGDMVYKKQLALANRPLVQLRAVRPCYREKLRLFTRQALRAVRSLYRKPARPGSPPTAAPTATGSESDAAV